MGGAECSTAGNPLSQLAKHAQDDQSLQRDRLVNRGPSAGPDSFRSIVHNGPAQDGVCRITMFEVCGPTLDRRLTGTSCTPTLQYLGHERVYEPVCEHARDGL